MMRREIYHAEGDRFRGAAFEVYNERGFGMAEEIYQESLEIELQLRGIPFQSKQELRCYYKGRELQKRYVPDMLVFGCLVVELKAVTQLITEHEAQLLNYLRITRQPVGYLLNYGHKESLEWRRFILSEFVLSSAPIRADSRSEVADFSSQFYHEAR
ncbi:MAG TPA: GxxExxY protein [Candidatus Didemnitutus sp.]|nr:GxxExxY protein [Candidatus Didemnitutus sp.]